MQNQGKKLIPTVEVGKTFSYYRLTSGPVIISWLIQYMIYKAWYIQTTHQCVQTDIYNYLLYKYTDR